jgi:hypothetical protein
MTEAFMRSHYIQGESTIFLQGHGLRGEPGVAARTLSGDFVWASVDEISAGLAAHPANWRPIGFAAVCSAGVGSGGQPALIERLASADGRVWIGLSGNGQHQDFDNLTLESLRTGRQLSEGMEFRAALGRLGTVPVSRASVIQSLESGTLYIPRENLAPLLGRGLRGGGGWWRFWRWFK